MKKYSTIPKRIKNKIPPSQDGIRFDDERRLQNAMLALRELDPTWRSWLAENVDADMPLQQRRKLIERQARALVGKNFSFVGPGFAQNLAESDYYFNDDGSLKAYL